jgi:probable solute:sodium symporter small subunit
VQNLAKGEWNVSPKDAERYEQHFRANLGLSLKLLLIWALVSVGAGAAYLWLDQFQILTGFPLGYYMGAQGAQITFVILIFIYAFRMRTIDQKYGVDE